MKLVHSQRSHALGQEMDRSHWRWVVGLCALLLAGLMLGQAASAVEPDEILADPALETRARALSAELRCLVCQNQSIDDSNAPLARDLRLLVRERIKAGDSDVEVRQFLVARYGDFVLLRPPFNWSTALLWLAPATLLLVTIFLIARGVLRRARVPVETAALTPEERARIDQLLKDERSNT
jgi:cytochrome c-type biogenesis protein CcmH